MSEKNCCILDLSPLSSFFQKHFWFHLLGWVVSRVVHGKDSVVLYGLIFGALCGSADWVIFS